VPLDVAHSVQTDDAAFCLADRDGIFMRWIKIDTVVEKHSPNGCITLPDSTLI